METIRPARSASETHCEYRDLYLGGTSPIAEQIAEMARSGWELVDLRAPHYGSLTIIGRFRRAAPPPTVVVQQK